jgi:hypothetical protein
MVAAMEVIEEAPLPIRVEIHFYDDAVYRQTAITLESTSSQRGRSFQLVNRQGE